MTPTRIVPDVVAVRALAHPVRTRMLGLLRLDGPATATQLALRLDLNSGAASYHLRQLEQHGFIAEDTERGTKRERWWRAVHDYTSVDAGSTDAERDASDSFAQVVAINLTDSYQRSVMERAELPDTWRHLSVSTDHFLLVTAAQAEELKQRVFALLDELAATYPPRPADPDPTAKQYQVQFHAFPRPGQLVDGSRENEPTAGPDEQADP